MAHPKAQVTALVSNHDRDLRSLDPVRRHQLHDIGATGGDVT